MTCTFYFSHRTSFPGMSSRTVKHKTMRTMLPTFVQSSERNSKFVIPITVKETWTHEFCCIPYTFQNTSPDFNQLDLLRESGHGKKKITFERKDFTHDEVVAELLKNFPQLKNVGGFTLHRTRTGGQGRPLIALPTRWYGIKDIKSAGVGAACIYIKPVEKNLDLKIKALDQVSRMFLRWQIPAIHRWDFLQKNGPWGWWNNP